MFNNSKILKTFIASFILLNILFVGSASAMSINFMYPTDNTTSVMRDWSYVNVSVSDVSDTSAFIDWGRSLVGYWSFESVLTNGTIYDNSTYSNNGIIRNHISNTTSMGKYGKALEFDGNDDEITCGNDSSLNFGSNPFSVEAWIKQSGSYNSINGILIKGDMSSFYVLYVTNTGLTQFSVSDVIHLENARSTSSIQDSNWHHVVGIRNLTEISIYLDGKLEGVRGATSMGNIDSPLESLTIGSMWSSYEFNGSIDEIRLWDRAISPAEINASYNSGIYRLSNNFTNLANGDYEYYAYAINETGETAKTTTHTVTIPSVIAPEVISISPANGTSTNDNTYPFVFRMNDSEIDIVLCTLWLNDTIYGSNTNVANNTDTTITSSVIPDGSYLWHIEASDETFNTTSEDKHIIIDMVSPTTTILQPENITYNTSTIPLNVSADETISAWYYELDNSGIINLFTPNTTISSLQKGNHKIIITATDSVGNNGTATEYFTVNEETQLLISDIDTVLTENEWTDATFTIFADYEYLNGTNVENAVCTVSGDITGTLTYNGTEYIGTALMTSVGSLSYTIECVKEFHLTKSNTDLFTSQNAILCGYCGLEGVCNYLTGVCSSDTTYDSTDITAIIIDFLGHTGVQFVLLATLIALILIFAFVFRKIEKK